MSLQQRGQLLVVADVLGLDDVLAGDALDLGPADAPHLVAGRPLFHQGVAARLHRAQHHLGFLEAEQPDQVLAGVGLPQLVRDGLGVQLQPHSGLASHPEGSAELARDEARVALQQCLGGVRREVGDAAFDDVAAVIQAPDDAVAARGFEDAAQLLKLGDLGGGRLAQLDRAAGGLHGDH